jgi:hypothetical protein
MNIPAPCSRRWFSPQQYWPEVPAQKVQEILRKIFRHWGRPKRMRVDNGEPWGSWSDLPPELALWLIGLGVDMVWIPPHTPQNNGVVERSQGTAKCWAEPEACSTPEALQRNLDVMDRIQRERYPFRDQRSRWETFPRLAYSGRPYSRTWERKNWDIQPVLTHLAGYSLPRYVDKSGRVSLYGWAHYVGNVHAKKTVYATFDPQAQAWLFADETGRQLNKQAAQEITQERIVSLRVSRRKDTQHRRAAKH